MARIAVFWCVAFALIWNEISCGSLIVKRTTPNSSTKRLQKTQETIPDLVSELAKAQLLAMIAAQHEELNKITRSIQTLQRDSCTNIKAVGKPVTHNSRYYRYGAWMKDPLGIMGTETIFVMPSFHGRNILEEYTNMEMFKAGVAHKKYTLPYRYDGTGAVVYGPYLYYNKENSSIIVKYSLLKENLEAQITISGFTPRKNGYGWGGYYTAVDLAVDEQGVWVLWGDADNNYRLHASKVDITRNYITRTWTLATEPMRTMGNAFVACGVIYCIDSYHAKSTTINFAYDTKTGKQWNPNIQFTNQYGSNYMVDYNPRERVLYAWNYRSQVTYSLTFEANEE